MSVQDLELQSRRLTLAAVTTPTIDEGATVLVTTFSTRSDSLGAEL
jgi:hypothetical protein